MRIWAWRCSLTLIILIRPSRSYRLQPLMCVLELRARLLEGAEVAEASVLSAMLAARVTGAEVSSAVLFHFGGDPDLGACAKLLQQAHRVTTKRLKALEAQACELAARASMLRAGVAMCGAAVGSVAAASAAALSASIKPFDGPCVETYLEAVGSYRPTCFCIVRGVGVGVANHRHLGGRRRPCICPGATAGGSLRPPAATPFRSRGFVAFGSPRLRQPASGPGITPPLAGPPVRSAWS